MDDPELFVLRVWRRPGFRAAVRVADEAEAQWFANPSDLVDFIAGRRNAATAGARPAARPQAGRRDGPVDTEL